MVSIVLVVMVLAYYNYVVGNMVPKYPDDPLVYYFLVMFHILFGMLVWSFIQTIFTDPGQIPIYWGFRVGDPEGR